MSSIWAVVPAAGSGRRMAAEAPKQYLRIAGISLLEHTLRGLLACPAIRGVVVALDPGDRRADTVASLSDPRVTRSSGGAERADSVLAGLEALVDVAGEQDWVLVHDAARPCLPLRNLQQLIDTVTETGMGTVLAQPVNDTVKRVDSEGVIEKTLDRSTLWRAQTPQMFRLQELRDALRRALEQGAAVTDEASAMEFAGYPVRVLEGPSCNLKVTVPEDLQLAEHYLKAAAAKRL
ncbi:MAG: 2-C-methyl-D-erythritol 4-phosphate cytidylyltransferase [Cellvibrionales bacterium]|jgi:2-C-methyl-D-erythritol 4-phosphate cytidylyltransferase